MMNFGNSIKKIAANINVGWKFYNVTGGLKPNCSRAVLDTLKTRNAPLVQEHLTALSFFQKKKENVFFSYPKTDATIQKSIIEPDQNLKIKVELPLNDTKDKSIELPFHIEKEISEPTGEVVIIKQARHLLVIRRLKMKKHKKKKHKRKFKIQIETRRIRKMQAEEAKLQLKLHGILQEGKNFSAEDFVKSKLEEYNWVKPVTHVRGILAPDWVIKKHLQDEEEKKMFKQRVKDCVNYKK